MDSFSFTIPQNIKFGAGTLDLLPDLAKELGKSKGYIISGPHLNKIGMVAKCRKALKNAGMESECFTETEGNPSTDTVVKATEGFKKSNADFIVAFGGGSPLDVAKAVAVLATYGGNIVDYEGAGKVMGPVVPMIAIPTTAGTGSETDAGAVITNPATEEKTGVFGTGTMPVLAIIDPELMRSVPAKFKAYQGFDALFHSTEGFISNKRNEMSKMVASEAIRNVSENLAAAIREPENVEAMGKVAFGSYLSGIQMCVGSCTSAHPLEHALSAYHENLPHGAGLIMISKAFYRFFINKHICDDCFIEMAKLMGMSSANQPEDFITALEQLQTDCGVADLKMSDYGITPDEFEKMAQNAKDTLGVNFENDPCMLSNADCVAIYQESYK